MNTFKKVFRITKKRDATYCPFLLEQRHTVLFIFHFWSSPEFEPPHWFQTVEEAENCVLEMYPNAVILDNYSGNKTRGGKKMAQQLKVFTTKWPDCYHSTIVYIDGDQIVATCMVTYEGKDKKEAVLWNLQVKKDYRRMGLGELLLKTAIDDAVLHRCPAIDLEWSPMDSVGWVFDWYKSYGFRVVSCDNKVRMTLTLQKGGKQ